MSPINMKSCCSSIVFGYVVHPEMYGFSQQTTAILGGTIVKRWNDGTMWNDEVFRDGELHWGGGSFHRGRHRATLPRRRAHCCGCFQTGWGLRSNYLLKWDGSRFDVQYILEINKKVILKLLQVQSHGRHLRQQVSLETFNSTIAVSIIPVISAFFSGWNTTHGRHWCIKILFFHPHRNHKSGAKM